MPLKCKIFENYILERKCWRDEPDGGSRLVFNTSLLSFEQQSLGIERIIVYTEDDFNIHKNEQDMLQQRSSHYRFGTRGNWFKLSMKTSLESHPSSASVRSGEGVISKESYQRSFRSPSQIRGNAFLILDDRRA